MFAHYSYTLCVAYCYVQFYGAAAQDFGSQKPDWETYGWALFRTPAIPANVYDKNRIEIQVSELWGKTRKMVVVMVGASRLGGEPDRQCL